MSSSPAHRLAVDVGGTFIDYVLLDEESGEIVVDKEPAFRDEVARQLFVGYDRVTATASAEVSRMIHGSTLAINTILQENGAVVGLITTRGFRDVLEIGRGNRVDIYDFFYDPPSSLVPRRLRREVTERSGPRGEVIAPLDLAELEREAEFLVANGVEAVAVCFFHAYANPAHERQVSDWLAARHPELFVTCSHEVANEWREYERTSSVVLNAYVMPTVQRYLSEIESGFEQRSSSGDFAIMQSNGGVMPPAVAKQVLLRTLESGPAGGVVGAQVLAEALGEPNVICADVGGTSFDVALVHDHNVVERYKTEVNKRPVLAPTADVTSIGAGGGSIAWIDDRNALRVGPASAGARPGPACFGFGGERPTVTDCNLLLGRLDAGNFLGRRMTLDPRAAEAALAGVADRIGMGITESAGGVVQLAEANMVYAIRQMTVERGHDPRSFALLAYGGGGGLFASALMENLEIPRAIVPSNSAVFSAWGLLFSDYREDAWLTRVMAITDETRDEFAELVASVGGEAREKLARHGVAQGADGVRVRADVRFVGQEHTLIVPIRAGLDAAALTARLKEDFADRHRAQYGQADITRDLEVVTIRATATATLPHPRLRPVEQDAAATAEPRSTREVWFTSSGGRVETAIWARQDLSSGITIEGPAVIEEWNATILVNPGQVAHIDGFGNIVITAIDRPGRNGG
jgi:N-methylhydantoinase A